jgi:hypothetical protein
MKTRTFFALSSLSVFALAGALATSPASAQQSPGIHDGIFSSFDVKTTVKNATNRDNWVDISESYKMKPGWSIQHAFCLTPGQSQTPTIRVNRMAPEIRVRAEVKNGNCRSGNLTAVSTHMDIPPPAKGSEATYLVSETRGNGSNYHVVINRK